MLGGTRLTRRLVVNADGFGFGPGATQGILDVIESGGFVTSVSVNANFPNATRVSELVERFPAVSIGVHLNPIVGTPCLPPGQVRTLVGPDGTFHGRRFAQLWRRRQIDPNELAAEAEAQVRRVRALAGSRLTHLDSHQNSHLSYLGVFLEVARRTGVRCMRTNASIICLEAPDPRRARLRVYATRPHVAAAHALRRAQMRRARRSGMRMADRLVTVGYAGTGNKAVSANWHRILDNLPDAGTYEVYCHPAYPDAVLEAHAAYRAPRREELRILGDPGLRHRAAANGIELVAFDALLDG